MVISWTKTEGIAPCRRVSEFEESSPLRETIPSLRSKGVLTRLLQEVIPL